MDITRLSNIERQQIVYQLLDERKRIRLSEVSRELGVSIATARRVVDSLVNQGKVQRVHGGAILNRTAPPEIAINERQYEQLAEKRMIGTLAADLIADGETVFISSGTTALEVAKNLVDRQRLTVITNSLPVLATFASRKQITLIALGGEFRHGESSFIGYLTDQNLNELRADKVIIGIRAISLSEGLTNFSLNEAIIDRKIISIGKEIIIVADHTKIDRVTTAFVAPITTMHTLVTGPEADPNFIEKLLNLGIKVVMQ